MSLRTIPPVPAEPPAALDPILVELLCCPVCANRPLLRVADPRAALICDRCHRQFPIHDGLPDLRPESGTLPTEPAATKG